MMATSTQAVPVYECSLQGAVQDELVHAVLERLRGLCTVESVLHYRETVYRPPPSPGLPLPTSASAEVMRVRCHIGENKWMLRNYNSMSSDKRAATVKNIVEIEVSSNVQSFLDYMGYKQDFEYIMKGFKFTAQKTLTITVTQIKKTDKGQETEAYGKMWLVDVSCLASDELLSQACDNILSFSEYLMPFVDIAKVERTVMEKSGQPVVPAQIHYSNFNNPTSPRPGGVPFPPGTAAWKKDPKRR